MDIEEYFKVNFDKLKQELIQVINEMEMYKKQGLLSEEELKELEEVKKELREWE